MLADVRQVVGDTPDMKALQLRVADELESAAETASGRITPEEFSDTARLLRWMADGNYAVLGYRRFEERRTVHVRSPAVDSGCCAPTRSPKAR